MALGNSRVPREPWALAAYLHRPVRPGVDGAARLASLQVVEIRDGRRRAAATATSLAEARRRAAREAIIGVLG